MGGRETSYSLTNGSTSLYSYSLSYFPNGNVMSSNDTINGDWVFGYDDLNRMTSATVTGQEHSPNATFAYLYDRFGNRWNQNVTSGSGPRSSLAFDANNHITASGVTYDAAGDVTYDGANTYTYDAEGRISADTNLNTQTFYDAQGRRDIIKAPNLQYPDYYVYDLQDHPLGINNPAYAYFRGEYYAGGRHVANFSNLLMFMHPDWLGTEHYRTESNGTLYGSCQNDPFGDNMWCTEAQGDLSPVHFTGKERNYSNTANPDGLDYFGARYYSSAMGRFTSPDWAAKPTAVPYAALGDPQTLNLYTFVVDDPISMIDPDGHQDCAGGGRSDPENHGLGTCDSIEKENKKAKTVCDASGLHCHTTVEVHAQSTACGPNSLCQVVLERLRWGSVFTITFNMNFFSRHFYKEEFSSGGCLNVAGRATVSALNPFSSTPSISSDAAAGAMTAGAIDRWNAAQKYAASRPNVLDGKGLIFPQNSKPYGKILSGSRAKALGEGILGYIDGALSQGFLTEAGTALAGGCD